jgi:hypothetical protein
VRSNRDFYPFVGIFDTNTIIYLLQRSGTLICFAVISSTPHTWDTYIIPHMYVRSSFTYVTPSMRLQMTWASEDGADRKPGPVQVVRLSGGLFMKLCFGRKVYRTNTNPRFKDKLLSKIYGQTFIREPQTENLTDNYRQPFGFLVPKSLIYALILGHTKTFWVLPTYIPRYVYHQKA